LSADRTAFADDHPPFGRACQGDTMAGSAHRRCAGRCNRARHLL